MTVKKVSRSDARHDEHEIYIFVGIVVTIALACLIGLIVATINSPATILYTLGVFSFMAAIYWVGRIVTILLDKWADEDD